MVLLLLLPFVQAGRQVCYWQSCLIRVIPQCRASKHSHPLLAIACWRPVVMRLRNVVCGTNGCSGLPSNNLSVQNKVSLDVEAGSKHPWPAQQQQDSVAYGQTIARLWRLSASAGPWRTAKTPAFGRGCAADDATSPTAKTLSGPPSQRRNSSTLMNPSLSASQDQLRLRGCVAQECGSRDVTRTAACVAECQKWYERS